MHRADVSKPAQTGQTGLTAHDPDRCRAGYTLCYSRGPGRQSARLLDMEGRTVHTWRTGRGVPWHCVEMLPDGHLLVVACTQAYSPDRNSLNDLFELDWNSNVVWENAAGAHHDARRLANGNTLVVCGGRAHYPQLFCDVRIYDYLQEIAPEGHVVWEWHFAPHAGELEDVDVPANCAEHGDCPHINTVERLPATPLGERDERFREGNVLVSPRHLHTVFVIDRDTGRIVWRLPPGMVIGQHQPTMLDSGNLLIFDNGRGGPMRGTSRVVEVEPTGGEIVWTYEGSPPEDFWSAVGSGNQRLDNGNTLICAMNWAETGRIFEVTPDGEIVWEYWNTERLPTYRAARYAPEIVEPLLGR